MIEYMMVMLLVGVYVAYILTPKHVRLLAALCYFLTQIVFVQVQHMDMNILLSKFYCYGYEVFIVQGWALVWCFALGKIRKYVRKVLKSIEGKIK